MGKVQNLKKRGQVNETNTTEVQLGNVNHKSPEDIEERLRRLENATTVPGGTSDVYKFAFFFFMGIALTILLYPGISRTIESLREENGVSAKGLRSDTHSEDFRDVDDTTNHATKGNNVSQKVINKTPQQTYTKKHELESEDRNPTETSTNANKKRVEDSLIGETDDDDKVKTITLEPFKESPNDIHFEREEDTLMDEENAPKTIKFEHSDENIDERTMKPERVELFSANIQDLPKLDESNKRTPSGNKKVDNPTKENAESKTVKLKKENKKTVKLKKENELKKENKNTDDKVTPVDEGKQNLPPEVTNFKATYLKKITPKKIFADGRRIPPMELLPQKPNNSSVKVWMFEEFLSEAECDGLMKVHNKHVEEQSKDDPILCFDSVATLRKHLNNVGKNVKVTPRDFTPGTTCVNASFSVQLKEWFNGNWSYSTAFYPGESRFASTFEQRVKEAMGLLPENGGKFQITSYPTGIGYKTHTDCTENSEDKRDRVATVLVYLDTISEGGGGETEFPELGIWVRPRKARALLWNNMDEKGDCEPMSVHKAAKVLTGHKFILQRWYYYKSFYSLGKRPPEPPLPTKKAGQPRVSCDEYENGSCRWYDEWNFEHMIEYEKRKYTLV